jgi:hypothetical protein
MKQLLVLSLVLTGCASTLPEIKHDLEEGAQKVAEAIDHGRNAVVAARKKQDQLRGELQPFAMASVQLCSGVPVDPQACADLDVIQNELFRAFDVSGQALTVAEQAAFDASAAFRTFSEGHGSFKAAFDGAAKLVAAARKAGDGVEQLLAVAKDYAEAVSNLAAKLKQA